MTDASSLVERLGALFVERFNVEVPSPDTDLLETGILDSLQLVELLLHLEQAFQFRVTIETLELDNLRTLRRLAHVLVAHGAPAEAADAAPTGATPRFAPDATREDAGVADAGRKAGERAVKPREAARLTLVSAPREPGSTGSRDAGSAAPREADTVTPPISVQGSG